MLRFSVGERRMPQRLTAQDFDQELLILFAAAAGPVPRAVG
jgi:hypothetical protein